MRRFFALLLTVTLHTLAVAGPALVPMALSAHSLLRSLPYEDRVELLALLQTPEENAERLLASEDPIDRGLGIFTAAFNADLDRILAARDLLFDGRRTIPTGMPTATWDMTNFIEVDGVRMINPTVNPREQSVRDYLRRVLVQMCGITPELMRWEDVHAVAKRVEREGSVWTYAGAWTIRYMVALGDEERSAALDDIRQLPEPLRLAVIHEICWLGSDTIDRGVAREIVQGVSDETKRKIREGTLELPPDLKYRDPEGNGAKALRQRAKYLLDGAVEPE